MVLNPEIWYSQMIRNSSHTLIKEKLMPESRIYHLLIGIVLFYTGIDRLGLAEAPRRSTDIVISGIARWGGRR